MEAEYIEEEGETQSGATSAEASTRGSLLVTLIGKDVLAAEKKLKLGLDSAERVLTQVIIALPPIRIFPQGCAQIGAHACSKPSPLLTGSDHIPEGQPYP